MADRWFEGDEEFICGGIVRFDADRWDCEKQGHLCVSNASDTGLHCLVCGEEHEDG